MIWECDLLISGIFTHISLPDNSHRRPFIQGFWDGNDWVLDNGNPLVYTNWASGQPEIVNNKRYLKFSNGEWKTSMASNIRPVFVVIYNRGSSCKIRKPLSVYDVLQFKVG